MIGLETLLCISLELYHNGHLSLLDVLRKLTNRPAEILALPGGHLRAGQPADLIVFDPGRAWRIKEARFLSKSKNSPFDGRPTQGRVLRTVVGGRSIFTLDA